eukprot:scaffold40705_cov33-Phaeocystis_antarctica.AAC.1
MLGRVCSSLRRLLRQHSLSVLYQETSATLEPEVGEAVAGNAEVHASPPPCPPDYSPELQRPVPNSHIPPSPVCRQLAVRLPLPPPRAFLSARPSLRVHSLRALLPALPAFREHSSGARGLLGVPRPPHPPNQPRAH